VTLQFNHSGDQVFNMGGVANPTQPDLFASVSALAADIRSGNIAGIQAQIDELDTHMTRVTAMRAETGNRLQQVNLGADRLDQTKSVLSELLGDTEGSDITVALVQLKEQENVFQAASYVGSTLSQGGLLQWLR
jgi:flagellin-like hook-associated protein FlgL